MDREEILNLIRDRMGFNKNFDEAIVYRHLDYVQQQYERVTRKTPLPWFLFNATYTTVTVADQRTISKPTNFITVHDNWEMTVTNADGDITPVYRVSDYDLGKDDRGATGLPTCYVYDGTSFYLYPKPDTVYTITLPHYAKSAELSESATHDWFTEFPTLIIEETLASIFKSNRDVDGLRLLNLTMERDDYHVRVEAMEHVGKSYVKSKNA